LGGLIAAGVEGSAVGAVFAASHVFLLDGGVAVLVVNDGFEGGAVAFGEFHADVDALADGDAGGEVADEIDLNGARPGFGAEGVKRREVMMSLRAGPIPIQKSEGEQKSRDAASCGKIGGFGDDGGLKIDALREFGGFGDDALFHRIGAGHVGVGEIDGAAKTIVKLREGSSRRPATSLIERRARSRV
jgi:hypothetical protein